MRYLYSLLFGVRITISCDSRSPNSFATASSIAFGDIDDADASKTRTIESRSSLFLGNSGELIPTLYGANLRISSIYLLIFKQVLLTVYRRQIVSIHRTQNISCYSFNYWYNNRIPGLLVEVTICHFARQLK